MRTITSQLQILCLCLSITACSSDITIKSPKITGEMADYYEISSSKASIAKDEEGEAVSLTFDLKELKNTSNNLIPFVAKGDAIPSSTCYTFSFGIIAYDKQGSKCFEIAPDDVVTNRINGNTYSIRFTPKEKFSSISLTGKTEFHTIENLSSSRYHYDRGRDHTNLEWYNSAWNEYVEGESLGEPLCGWAVANYSTDDKHSPNTEENIKLRADMILKWWPYEHDVAGMYLKRLISDKTFPSEDDRPEIDKFKFSYKCHKYHWAVFVDEGTWTLEECHESLINCRSSSKYRDEKYIKPDIEKSYNVMKYYSDNHLTGRIMKEQDFMMWAALIYEEGLLGFKKDYEKAANCYCLILFESVIMGWNIDSHYKGPYKVPGMAKYGKEYNRASALATSDCLLKFAGWCEQKQYSNRAEVMKIIAGKMKEGKSEMPDSHEFLKELKKDFHLEHLCLYFERFIGEN